MSQISPPMRIVLAVAVLFGVVYMVALKPKNDVTPAPAPVSTPAPAAADASDANKAQTSLGKAVEAAHGAAAATEAKQNSEAAAAGEATTAPSTTNSTPATEATPAATAAETKPVDDSLKGLPKWLQTSMDHKVVAILFTNGKSADDKRTAKALKKAYDGDGKVVTRAVPIGQIAKYRPVAEGVDVSQSPTLMVIDRNRVAQALVGYSNLQAINQAIIDSLLATDNPVKHVKYLQTVQHECKQINTAMIIGPSVGDTPKGFRKNLDAAIVTIGASIGTLNNAPRPAAYRSVGKDLTHYLGRVNDVLRAVRDEAIGKHAIDEVKVRQLTNGLHGLETRTLLHLNAVGVDACN